MTMRTRTTLLLALCGGTALALGTMLGCEDASARQRAEFQQTIQTASQEFRLAAAARPDPEDANAERVRSDLRSIVGRLDSPAEVEPGQQAAAKSLAAQALHELAAIDMIAIERRERDHRLRRERIIRDLDSATLMAALASGFASVTTEEQRQSLQRDREQFQTELNALVARLGDLDGPIGERSQRNTAEAEQVRQLRAEADELLRRALELGYSRGFSQFEQSVGIRREADRLEYGIAQREIELDRDLNPEHALASARHEHLQAAVDSIQSALDHVAAYERLSSDQADALRAEAAQRRDAVLEAMRQLANSDQELAGLYEQAIGHLERAVNAARQAATRLRGADGQGARLAEARSHEALGNALRTKIQGINDQINLLNRLIESGEALRDVEPFREQRSSLAAASEESVERARTAFEAAQKILEQMPAGGGGDALNSYKGNLEATVAALAGETVDWAAVRAAQSGGELDREFSVPAGERGFASVEEAVAALRAADMDDMNSVRQLFSAMHATTPAAKVVVSLVTGVIEAAYDLERAMMDQFGVANLDEAFGSMASMAVPQVGEVRILDQSDDHATLMISADGEEDDLRLVNINGRWMIDADAEFDGGPEAAMMLAMMEPMFRSMIEMIGDLAAKVRAGEFDSPDQVAQAMMQQTMGGMGMPMPGDADGMDDFEMPEGMQLPDGFDWPGGK